MGEIILPLVISAIVLAYYILKSNKEKAEKESTEQFFRDLQDPEKRAEIFREAELQQQVQYGLSSRCPNCGEYGVSWKKVDSTTTQQLDSAFSMGTYTQVNVRERETARFMCSKCKFIVHGSRIK